MPSRRAKQVHPAKRAEQIPAALASVTCWLTPGEVAAWLKVEVRQLVRMGVPRVDLGRRTKRYDRVAVLAWLERQRGAA